MNNTFIKGLCSVAVVAFMSGCADDEIAALQVEKPSDRASYEYLNGYDVLKNYVNPKAGPDFRLGLALDAGEFNNRGLVHALAVSNFSEVTAGNAMKYASCVKDDGRMDFSKVEKFVATAKAAGITIYGHTLAWHAQQNNKYLNSLIADKEIEVDPEQQVEKVDYEIDYSTSDYNFWNQIDNATIAVNKEEGCLDIINPDKKEQNYFVQYHVADGISIKKGGSYTLKMLVRATDNGTLNLSVGNWGETSDGSVQFTTEWKELTMDFQAKGDGGFVMAQSGLFAGTIQIKAVKITHSEAPAMEIYTDIISNGDAEGNDVTNFVSTHVGGSNDACDIVEGAGVDGSRAFVVTSAGGGVNNWDTQFFLKADRPLVADEVVRVSFDYRADVANNSESQAHSNPGGYIHYDAGCAVSFTTEWQHFEKIITVNSTISPSDNFQTFAWNLDVGAPSAPANKYYFDNVKLQVVTEGNKQPMSPEEKKEVLTTAMNTWVEGMMKATEGNVSAWDVVNEAISGGDNDGDGKYDLQSAKNVSAEDAKNNFYWQDYLGDEDYIRIVVAAARKYYAENGGTAPLKLFINDYNLESDWDDNKKLKSLIEWIKVWESDGVTKIDGIGTQMHVSCYANPETQASKEKHVVKMLELLAESGKLVKISELDMGYVDETGNDVKTENMTEEQHLQMAHYYKFIIKKYFEIIPPAQQYSITQWCATDAPADSGWRGGQPVGLWDSNWNRKHTYAGFADGLAGKE